MRLEKEKKNNNCMTTQLYKKYKMKCSLGKMDMAEAKHLNWEGGVSKALPGGSGILLDYHTCVYTCTLEKFYRHL